MIKPLQPSDEKMRLASLKSLNILDTDQDSRLDDLVTLASEIADSPIALVSLVDADRQWFKSRIGLESTETSRDISFCGHAIHTKKDLFEISDASSDERFYDNPLVTGDPSIRHYAGKPLTTKDGYNIGTLCVIDRVSKKLSEKQKNQIGIIAQEVVSILEDYKTIETLKSDVNSKAAFVASMSHELRTPLTSVIGFTDVLFDQINKEHVDQTEALKTISILKSSSEHLVGLIGDILDFSKLEANKYLINNETFQLSQILKQVYNTLNVQAEKYDVDFSIHQSMSTPEYVYGDITLTRQILINLGSNAIKFSNGETVEIKVDLSKKNNQLAIDFIDTGVGMTPEEAGKIFRPFVQASNKIAKKFDGTGLGLAITREITDLLGGSISLIKSEKNVGTHFRVELPYVEKLENHAPPFEEGSALKQTEDFSGKKFLIVDDVKENRFLVRHYLKGLNADFRDAATGEEALEKFDNTYDFILLDMQLPDMNGQDVFRQIKPKLKEHQKVIAFTASSTTTGVDDCLKIGFSNYLTKPFDTESIMRSLKKHS